MSVRQKKKLEGEVLVTTVGVEPQVVTLTLDALLAKGHKITSIYIVHPNTQNTQINAAIKRLQEERNFYSTKNSTIRFRFTPVRENDHYPTDFVTERDVGLLLRVLYRTVASLKRKGCRVHLSIAGGRKVMTAMGMVVAQLLLDENDYVWHLLSEGALLQSKSMHAQKPDEVVLVPIPVLRWSLMPSTVQDLLVWDDPYRAIERQRELYQQQRWHVLNSFWQKLTPAEREVIKALVKYGEKNTALAKRLNRSVRTVSNQLQSVYNKYREHFELPSEAKVRDRIIADLSPVLAMLK
ncbi:MAG: CRISPR-associated ring nuclease [Armatimonadetes bacterium]|nr:CRISPR-associated ring nuclease [Armatimonadota bacterium]MDW8028438.1 CRISPR-associated ring nuclease [Armatimonadota bacterium]